MQQYFRCDCWYNMNTVTFLTIISNVDVGPGDKSIAVCISNRHVIDSNTKKVQYKTYIAYNIRIIYIH